MAPNLDVRSESWVDLLAESRQLSLDGRQVAHRWAKNGNCKLKDDQQLQQQASRVAEASEGHSAPSMGTRGESEPRMSADDEHLLIRWRQRSYHLNRSSTNSLASNLSNSIELTPSLVQMSSQSLTEASKGGRQPAAELAASAHLKAEPRKLRLLKDRLLQRSGRRNSAQASTPSALQAAQATGGPSPLARSWSSFSQKISGKFTHLRHSWKHFLYAYNHMERELDESPSGQWAKEEAKRELSKEQHSLACMSLDKRQLTDQWLARCHHRLHQLERPESQQLRVKRFSLDERPKSLEISSQQQAEPGKLRRHLDRQHHALAGDFDYYFIGASADSSRRRRHIEQEASDRAHLTHLDHSSSNSSTTLVSHTQQQPLPSPSSSILDSIGSQSTLDSKSSPARPQMSHSPAGPTRRPLGSAHKVASLEQQQVTAPTSDYWSTVASSSDYYKLQQQQYLLLHNQQQQVHNLMGHTTGQVNDNLLQNQPSIINQQPPMLISQLDQDYYLDVAKAEALAADQRSQEQQQQLVFASPSSPNQLLSVGMQNFHVETSAPAQAQLLRAQFKFQQQQMPASLLQFAQKIDEEDYEDDYAVPSDESYRLERSQVELVQMIGEGQKGYVFLGKLQSKDGQHISDVAIKTLKYETDQLIERLMREAAMMRQFEHPHIIKFIGVCPETPALIAMELAPFGTIKEYLKLNRALICCSQLVLFTFQISTALSYLESKHYVHRDVAARNILVCSHNCVKLADFGLSRNLQPPPACATNSASEQAHQVNQQQQQLHIQQLYHDTTTSESASDWSHYVAASRGIKLPVRWLAPESLAFRRFTSASDVWMFAVCSWELFHFGQLRPWAQIRNNQVLLAIESGQRLARPPACPQRLYQLMLQCWSYAPVQRPKFRELKQSLWSIYLAERAREQLEFEQLELERLELEQEERHRRRHEQQQRQQQTSLEQRHLAMLKPRQVAEGDLLKRLPFEEPEQQQGRAQHQWPQVAQSSVAARPESPTCGAHQRSPVARMGKRSVFSKNSNLNSPAAIANVGQRPTSRSSSSGSLVNHSPIERAAQQGRHLHPSSRPGPLNGVNQAANFAPNSSPAPPQATADVIKQDFHLQQSAPLTAAGGHEQQPQQQLELTVSRNMRRFQQRRGTPAAPSGGHIALQKQRSQGSIVAPTVLIGRQEQSRLVTALDDHALLDRLAAGKRVHQQQQQQHRARLIASKSSQLKSSDYEDDDDDEDDDRDSSTDGKASKLISAPLHLLPRAHQQHNSPRARATPASECGVESSARSPSSASPRHSNCSALHTGRQANNGAGLRPGQQQLTSNVMMVRPLSLRNEVSGSGQGESSWEREQKLSDLLQSLRVSPLKAKLSYNTANQSQEQPNHLSPRSPTEQAAAMKRIAAGGLSGASERLMTPRGAPQGAAPGEKSPGTRQVDMEEEERALEERRLAIHQRLLGHIRRQPSGSSGRQEKRRSANLEQGAATLADSKSSQEERLITGERALAAKSVETVDQSLRLLESLIEGERNLSGVRHEPRSPATAPGTSRAPISDLSSNNSGPRQVALGVSPLPKRPAPSSQGQRLVSRHSSKQNSGNL